MTSRNVDDGAGRCTATTPGDSGRPLDQIPTPKSLVDRLRSDADLIRAWDRFEFGTPAPDRLIFPDLANRIEEAASALSSAEGGGSSSVDESAVQGTTALDPERSRELDLAATAADAICEYRGVANCTLPHCDCEALGTAVAKAVARIEEAA